MYTLQTKTKFRKDVRLAHKRGWNLDLLEVAATLLTETGTLPAEYLPHPLRGNYVGCIDAHIRPDWVLIYEMIEAERVIVLHRTGTHADLF